MNTRDEILKTILDDIFPNILIDVKKFEKLLTHDLTLPQEFKSDTNKKVFASPEYGYKKFISMSEDVKRIEESRVEKGIEFDSWDQAIREAKKVAYFSAERQINSEFVNSSDDVYSSSYIFNSTHIFSCQKLISCNNCFESDYLAASKGSRGCNFGVRLIDCVNTNTSFECSWLANCSRVYFSHSCEDLTDCMFCFHLKSKQFCIANMQYSKEEYEKIRELLLKEYIKKISSTNSFWGLKDLS